MVEAQRALLDELMGTARDLTAEERKAHREIRWDDKEVCGCYLVKFCPHELFVNTKSDLGPCSKIHDAKLKESYEQSTRHNLYVSRFEAELLQFCEKLVQDLDRKVRRGRERLAQDLDASNLVPISTEKSDQLVNIEESIKKFLEEIETFGEEGKVDEAEALMKKVDVLNIEKAVLMQQISNDRGLILSQEKKMALCETCGSFLVANDATGRTQSHMTGKQHVGFGLVREYVIEYQARKEKAREEERAAQEREDGSGIENNHEKEEKEKEKERVKEKEKEKVKEKEKCVREREERERKRERYRDKERADRYRERTLPGVGRTQFPVRDRDRYRDRDRNKRDRDVEKGRDRDRERERERDRNKTRSRSPPTTVAPRSPLIHHQSRRRSRSHSPDHRV